MTYSKPEVKALSSALRAIQGGSIKGGSRGDANNQNNNATVCAYEADE